jgi:5'-3' exonuclease
MGVPGLWKDVEPLGTTVHVRTFRDKQIGIDAANWIHKAASECAMELAKGSCDSLVRNVVKRAGKLVKAGWKLTFVFDGLDPPMKAVENTERLVSRHTSRQLAVNLFHACASLPAGLATRRSAEFSAREIIERDPVVGEYSLLVCAGLRAAGFETRVAPMEAEAQLAYMCRTGSIYAVLSEDTDTVMYYAPRVIRRIDGLQCEFYDLNCDWGRCGPIRLLQSPELFVAYCVLSGCDYLEWSAGVLRGPKLAQWIATAAETDPTVEVLLDRAVRERSRTLPADKIEATVAMAIKAAYAILHHLVFDEPRGQDALVRHIFPVPEHRLRDHAKLLKEACGDAAQVLAAGRRGGHTGSVMFREGASILQFPPLNEENTKLDVRDGSGVKTLRLPATCTKTKPPQYIPLMQRDYELLNFDSQRRQPADQKGLSWWCSLCEFGQGSRAKTLPQHVQSKMHAGRVHLCNILESQRAGIAAVAPDLSQSASCIVLIDSEAANSE